MTVLQYAHVCGCSFRVHLFSTDITLDYLFLFIYTLLLPSLLASLQEDGPDQSKCNNGFLLTKRSG